MHDTLGYVKRLEAVGVPRAQAEIQVEIMAEFIDANFATKHDLKEEATLLRTELRESAAEIKAEMRELRIELQSDMKALRTEVKHDISQLENRLTIKLGTIMTVGLAALATIIKYL